LERNMKGMMGEAIVTRIANTGIIAVLVVDDPEVSVTLARTLLDNGILGMELTLRTESALECLRRIRDSVPGMMAGIGTILTPGQVKSSLKNGAEFGVAPGYNREVVACAREAGLPFAPGIATPSELEGALSQGCGVLKLFPAEGMGGIEYLKSINAPYKHLGIKYIPLGGISASNLASYLAMKEVIAVGGSWIAPQELIRAKDWTKIGNNAREAMEIFRSVRSAG
jgi:2-dehydro-3-deoxyphosphogluconate aldolase / (4S)-4-hydroxy-2-oxoglutarate aldolase